MELLLPTLQLLAMLLAVVALAYLVLTKGLGRFLSKHQITKTMALEERLMLEPKKSLYLVKIKNKRLVLGGSENGISVVCDLDEKIS